MVLKRKILAAVDLNEDTGRILAYALWFAEAAGAGSSEIDMLHVMDYALTPPAYVLPYIERERVESEKALEEWKRRLAGFEVHAEFRIAVGRLIETFSKAIKETDAGIMVLGHKSHILRASSSERLMRSADITLLVVRGRKAEGAVPGAVDMKRILCAVDFSENSRRAVDFARALAAASSSDLVITNIVSKLKLEESFKRFRDMSEEEREGYRGHAIRQAEEDICSVLQVCGGAQSLVKIGDPYSAINEVAAERDAGLIVIGARGLSPVKGAMLGSVAESVVKSSPCPVVIVR